MQHGRRDDNDRFIQAIASISAAPEVVTPLGRQLRCENEGALSALLTEIDETVLRRQLVFQSQQQDALVIDVAERRLLSFRSIPEKMEKTHSALLRKSLQDTQVSEAYALLSAFAASIESVFVRSNLPEDDQASEFGGIPAWVLREQSHQRSLPDLPRELKEALETSFEQVKALSILLNGELVFRFGDRVLSDTLCDRAMKLEIQATDRRQVTLWSGSPDTDSVLLVEAEDALITMVTDGDKAAECFAVWQECTSI